jgi:hypothetical protein
MAAMLRSGKRLKRAPGGGEDDNDDDGLPFSDEMLLLIFAALPETVDLVRCAATCRRWLRLVSGEASSICRSDPGQFVPVGFFHQGEEYGMMDVPRFVPLASHFPSAASANALFNDEPFRSSRVVTSRKGRLVLELCRASRLWLAVCNPMTRNVSVLPALAGRDSPGRYACALLTADDDLTGAADPPPSSASSFRLVIVYGRRDFMACRTYSSDAGSWGPEGIVTGDRVSWRTLAQAHAAAAVARGAVFWRVKDAVLALRLDSTLEAALEPLPEDSRSRGGGVLAVSPGDGRLCVVEASRHEYWWKREVEVRVLFREHSGGAGEGGDVASPGREKWVASRRATLQLRPPSGCRYGDKMTRVSARGVCEKSGVVFLAAVFDSSPQQETLYALDLGRMEARLLRDVPDVGCRSGLCASFVGYEMHRLAYLTSIGKKRGVGMGTITVDVDDDIYNF